MIKKKLSIIGKIIILIAFFIPTLTILKNKKILFEKFDAKTYEKKYYQSQWIIPNSKNPISDIDLYAYAGYRYIKGENPILINPEVPPLGKYLIGFSILVFKNFRIINLFFCYLCLFLIFFLSYKLTKSLFQSSISILLTSLNTLFIDQIINAGQLEIFQLFFLLTFLFVFNEYLKNKKFFYLILLGITFGFFISIKFFFYFYLIINFALILFFIIIKNQKKINFLFLSKTILIINIIALITYSLIYFQFFIKTDNPIKFFGMQKWILNFYSQSNIDKVKIFGSYLLLLFFNQWRYWSKNYPLISYKNWSLLWPMTFILGIYSFYYTFKKNFFSKNSLIPLIFSFFFMYNLFLLITPIYPRYFLLLLIPINIIIPIILKI